MSDPISVPSWTWTNITPSCEKMNEEMDLSIKINHLDYKLPLDKAHF